jgi:hypothetical protein
LPTPLKITPAAEERILGILAMGGDYGIAAKHIGVTRQAVSAHIKRHPKFAERVEEFRSMADENVKRSLYRAARNGNVTAMIFWLKNRQPEHWRDRREIVAEVTEHRPVQVEFPGCTTADHVTAVPDSRPN